MKKSVSFLSVNQLIRKMPIRQSLFSVLFLSLAIQGCSSTEDDASMESTEPVEAAPAESSSQEQPAAEQAPPSNEAKAEAPPPALETPPAAAATPTKEASPSVSGSPMNTSRRVMYVKVDSAVLREQPEAKSKVVGTASQGDHFLVSVDGDWAKTEDGRYISMKVLSEKGVGRTKKSAEWGQSQGTQEQPKKKSAKKRKTAAPASTSGGTDSAVESSTGSGSDAPAAVDAKDETKP